MERETTPRWKASIVTTKSTVEASKRKAGTSRNTA